MADHVFPRGALGYPMYHRNRVVSHVRFWQNSALVGAHVGVSQRTVQRYRRSLRTAHTVAPRAHSGGRPRVMSTFLSYLVLWFTLCFPDALLDEIAEFVARGGGFARGSYSVSQVSRELKFLGFTRKKLSKRSQNARFLEQWNWWNNPPVGGPGIAGMLGVPTEMLIDMDESGIIVAAANRRYGHALRGQRAIAQLTAQRRIRYTLILAIDIVHGVVAYWIFNGNTNTASFFVFLSVILLPRISLQHRVLMFDNHSAHLADQTRAFCEQSGHMVLCRPAYSPHFAFIESAFGKIKTHLRRKIRTLTEDNLHEEIQQGIASISAGDVQGWAADCHYSVHSRQWRPWHGD